MIFEDFSDYNDNFVDTFNDTFDNNTLIVDFNNDQDIVISKKTQEKQKKSTDTHGYTIVYDKQTMETYRVMRKLKIDPFTACEINKYAFEFPYMWDPYTGSILDKDPNGPLCFDPDTLIKYFYCHRLDNLWVNPKDELSYGNNGNNGNNGYYEGYYGDGVGAGEEFYIKSRGNHPERYLFRLPILDCYLTKDHNNQIVTFGPKLSNEDVKLIDTLANNMGNSYRSLYNCHRPSLSDIKRWYDIAISQTPEVYLTQFSSSEEDRAKANRYAVDKLRTIMG